MSDGHDQGRDGDWRTKIEYVVLREQCKDFHQPTLRATLDS